MLLKVVRRQPMIFRADEGLEERPGLARQLAQELRAAQASSLASRRVSGRLIHQAIAGEANQSSRIGPATTSVGRLHERQTQMRRRRPAPGPIHIGAEEVPRPSRLAAPDPPEGFHSSKPPGEITIRQSVRTIASRLIERLVRQAGEREGRPARSGGPPRASAAARCCASSTSSGLRSRSSSAASSAGMQHDAEHRQRPEPGARQHGPAQQQQQRQRGGHQAAPQVVENLPPRQAESGLRSRDAAAHREPAAAASARSASRRESSDGGGSTSAL